MKRGAIVTVILAALLFVACMITPALADVLTIPDGVTVIEEEAFCGSTSLDTVVLPEGITTIGDRAFAESGIKEINLPDSLESIADHAFDSVSHYIYMKANVGSYAFNWGVEHGFISPRGESPLEWFTFSANGDGTCKLTQYVGEKDNSSDIVIPERDRDGNYVTSIGQRAFYNCPGLTGKLSLPESLISIETYAFTSCSGFTGDLIIPDSVQSIGYYAFNGCRGFNGILSLGNSLSFVGEGAFMTCYGLTGDLVIPESLTTISKDAFRQLSEMKGNLIIPDGVTTIGDSAFAFCSGFTGNLTIPESLTVLERHAFYGCSGFTGDLVIPASINAIKEYTFSQCSGFNGHLIIPDTVESIGQDAFRQCSGLTGDLLIPDSVISIGDNTFCDCSGFTGNLIIPDSVTVIGKYAFCRCSGLDGNLTISNSVTEIKEYAFHGCKKLTGDIIIPNSVKTIGNYAFNSCTGFNGSLLIQDGVISIGEYAFWACTNLSGNLSIPESVNQIGRSAFGACNNLSGTVTIPQAVNEINTSTFEGCVTLSKIVFTGTINNIGKSAFKGCNNLESIIFSQETGTIGDNAFGNCPKLNITCIDGSTVHLYAMAHNIPCTLLITDPDTRGSLTGKVTSAVDGSAVSDADVRLYRQDLLYRIGTTDQSGSYEFVNLLPSEYRVVVEADGHIKFELYATVEAGGTNYSETAQIISGTAGQTGSATGKLINAITKVGISGATIEARRGWNNTDEGSVIKTATTDASGNYSLQLEAGNYTLNAYVDNYLFSHQNILILPGSSNTLPDYTLTPVSGDGAEFRIILTWGSSPRDLDSHLRGKVSNGNSFHVAFDEHNIDKGHEWVIDEGMRIASIDLDDTSSYGPEIISLNPNTSYPYYYYIHRFSGDGAINTSGAKIEVFHENTLIKTYNVPTDQGTDLYWNVFALIDGQIVTKNTFSSSPDTSYANSDNPLTGSFTNHNLSLALGEKIVPEGSVTSLDKDIYRVTLTISGWNQDGTTSNRYVSDPIGERLSTKSINLNELTDFYLDTTREPLNTPGEYTINLWASTTEGEGVKLDSMMVKVVSSSVIKGTLSDLSGAPIPAASIMASADGRETITAISGEDGNWSLVVDQGISYTISYWHSNYDFDSQNEMYMAGACITAYGKVREKPNISFTVLPATIPVGGELTFNVEAPGATRVRLLIDGVSYDDDVYELDTQGKVTFTRKITKYVEKRSASFIALVEGEWSSESNRTEFYMTQEGALDPVNIDALPSPHRTGQNLEVTWSPVDHATGFTVYLYNQTSGGHITFKDQDIVRKDDGKYAVTIPSDVLETGYYGISVMAYGLNYSQSESGATLWVRPPYTPQQGWAQQETVPTYIFKDGEYVQKGWITYDEPVLVLDKIDEYYYIEMTISPEYNHGIVGGTDRRYIHDDSRFKVGEDCRWEPELSMTVEYEQAEDKKVSVRLIINRDSADEAGVKLEDMNIVIDTVPRTEYELSFTPEPGLNNYTIYAKKGDLVVSKEILFEGGQIENQFPDIPAFLYVSKVDSIITSFDINVNSADGSLQNIPNDWNLCIEVQGIKDEGFGAFAVNYHSDGSKTYEYIQAGTDKWGDKSVYQFQINPFRQGQIGYRASQDNQDGFASCDYDYVFIPLELTRKVGDRYYVDQETIDYLVTADQFYKKNMVTFLKHYFVNTFTEGYSIGECKCYNQIVQSDGSVTVDTGEIVTLHARDNCKIARILVNGTKYYALAGDYALTYLTTESELVAAIRDKMKTSFFNLSVSRNILDDYIMTMKPRFRINFAGEFDITSDLTPGFDIPFGLESIITGTKFYLIAKWEEDGEAAYSEPVEITSWSESTDINLTASYSTMKLQKGCKYQFALAEASYKGGKESINYDNLRFIYTYYIPVSNTDQKTEALKQIVYAYDHNLNALTGKNIVTGQMDSSYEMKALYLEQYVSNRISSFGVEKDEVQAIVDTLKEAKNDARNLYLFSMWDYDVKLDVAKIKETKTTSTAYQQPLLFVGNTIIILQDDYGPSTNSRRDFVTFWFHESGHGADRIGPYHSDQFTSMALNSYDLMKNDFKEQIYKAANGYGLADQVDSYQYTKAQTDIIAEYLMNNQRNEQSSMSRFENNLTATQKASNCSWNDALSKTEDKLISEIKAYCGKYSSGQRNALTISDAEQGMMDNYLKENGMLVGLGYHSDGYWFDGNKPNGMQEKEAFAEFFASNIIGVGESDNRIFFPSTCIRFENIIRTNNILYREKYKHLLE